jgi:hypothetical protein
MANDSFYIGRSPGQRYCRDSHRTRCLRSDQCNGLDRFSGSAASARKGIIVRGCGRPRLYLSRSRTGTGIASAAIARADGHVTVDGRIGARHKRVGSDHREPILASMYRHLAHWPAYLALVWTVLAPLKLDQRLDRAIEDTIAQARARAQCLAAQLPTPLPAIRPITARRVERAIDRFTGDVIAKMVVICSLLRRLTDS